MAEQKNTWSHWRDDITRDGCLKAIDEFRADGRDAFLEKYGYRYATEYYLHHEGNPYDSKAIVGVARKFDRPELGPASSKEFSGGKDAAAGRAQELGFTVSGDTLDRSTEGRNHWLLVTKENELGGRVAHDDDPPIAYQWDNKVPHHQDIARGDLILLTDTSTLLGISVVDQIEIGKGFRDRHLCPKCSRSLKNPPRSVRRPRWKCSHCKAEFEDPRIDRIPVTTYRTDHAANWIDLENTVPYSSLKSICNSPSSIQSMRPVRPAALEELLNQTSLLEYVETYRTDKEKRKLLQFRKIVASLETDSLPGTEHEWSEKDQELLPEGSKKRVTVNAYERNPAAREACLKHRGYACSVCEFNFEDVYGDRGKHFIHVHHIVPVSSIGKEYTVDPKKDLIPVCPNCHAMIHRKPLCSTDELRRIMSDAGDT